MATLKGIYGAFIELLKLVRSEAWGVIRGIFDAIYNLLKPIIDLIQRRICVTVPLPYMAKKRVCANVPYPCGIKYCNIRLPCGLTCTGCSGCGLPVLSTTLHLAIRIAHNV